MENQNDNREQIIRRDARGCFVELKNDCFHLNKIHLQFVAYDKSRPAGQRYTNNINIYIDVPQFLALSQQAANGDLHKRMLQYKKEHKPDALLTLGRHIGQTAQQIWQVPPGRQELISCSQAHGGRKVRLLSYCRQRGRGREPNRADYTTVWKESRTARIRYSYVETA